MHMSFNEFILMKALALKASLSGRGNSALLAALTESQGEAIGMKNMCFRVDPLTQARFEAAIGVLNISKQEALTEMLSEMLDRIDEQLKSIGLEPVSFTERLQELGYELSPPDADGLQSIVRVHAQ